MVGVVYGTPHGSATALSDAYLRSEKQLFTITAEPVASSSLPTPLPWVSSITKQIKSLNDLYRQSIRNKSIKYLSCYVMINLHQSGIYAYTEVN